MLVINRNRAVGSEALIDAVWGELARQEARASLHTYVSNLRRFLNNAGVDGRAVLAAAPSGYRLTVPDIDCDIGRFVGEKTAGIRAAAAGRFDLASRHLSAAVSEWRGRALEDLQRLRVRRFVRHSAHRGQSQRAHRLAEAEIACGRGNAVIGTLEGLVTEHPYREPLWAQLITAYYVAERQSDALDAYRRLKTALAEDLGIEPGPTIRATARASPPPRGVGRATSRAHRRCRRREHPRSANRGVPASPPWRDCVHCRDRSIPWPGRPLGSAGSRITMSCSTTPKSAATTPWSATRAPVSSSPICALPTVFTCGDRRIRGSVALADRDRVRICEHEFVFEIESHD